ncbi:MAG: DUF3106 domain-containing protein [Planctomycetes bacterium]|nr:DUF3106 domain-containing protein [Planctomycetota bacterium]
MFARYIQILTALLVLGGAAAAQESRPSPKERWEKLSDAEKDKLRKIYSEYKKLAPEEQAHARERAKVVWRERQNLEDGISPEGKATLDSLGKDDRDHFLRGAVIDMLRSRHNGIVSNIPREKMEEFSKLPQQKREQEIRKWIDESLPSMLNKAIDWGVKKKLIDDEEAARLHSLPQDELMRALLEIRKNMILNDLDSDPRKFEEFGRPDTKEMRSMTVEKFFEKLESMRMVPHFFKNSHGESGTGSRFGGHRPPGPGHDRDGDHDRMHEFGREHERPPFFDSSYWRQKAKSALITKGISPEEAEKQVSEANGMELLKILGADRNRRKPESGPSSRRGI